MGFPFTVTIKRMKNCAQGKFRYPRGNFRGTQNNGMQRNKTQHTTPAPDILKAHSTCSWVGIVTGGVLWTGDSVYMQKQKRHSVRWNVVNAQCTEFNKPPQNRRDSLPAKFGRSFRTYNEGVLFGASLKQQHSLIVRRYGTDSADL